jgi:hypothetical protein
MRDVRDNLVDALIRFFQKHGIEPIYAFTIFALLITLSYWKDFKNWNNRPNWVKRYAVLSIIVSFLGLILSVFRFTGLL